MRTSKLMYCTICLFIIILLMTFPGCSRKETGKIPVTTSSEEALKLYLQGRELYEKLQAQESIDYFKQAIAADSNFAMAYLNLALVSPSTKEFFFNFDKALTLTDKISEGERLWIMGVQAGINAFPMQQKENFLKIVEIYPNDERAHNLLGGFYFGQQEYDKAIESYTKSTIIAPQFSQPYNQLGYSYRFLGDYQKAEEAFQKYIELIPNDPNPYDSYAELLMKMGKFEESIEHYRKALSINPNFIASQYGIACNLNFLGKYEEARQQLQQLYDTARNDGERRGACFAMAVSYTDEGNLDKALQEIQKIYDSNLQINDTSAMANNLLVMALLLEEMNKPIDARIKIDQSLEIIQNSNLSQQIKDNALRNSLYNYALVDIKQNDLATAKTRADEFLQQVEAINNPLQMKAAHQLLGMIALQEKDYARAVDELLQGNMQDPYNLYRLASAYDGSGNKEKAEEFYLKAADFNVMNNLNYAFIRKMAKAIVSTT